jgi:L-lactate dehydrogenase complex protein LldE
MKIDLFIPCFIDQFYPETAINTVKVLEKAGCMVNYNPQQTCCGMPAYHAGYWDEAKEVGNKFLSDFQESDCVVTPSATCVGMIRTGYNDLFTNSMVHNQCRNLQGKVFELADFLVNVLQREYFGAELEGKAVLLESCVGQNQCQQAVEPRVLLSRVLGLELLEAPDSDTCCGFGGMFSVKFDAISSAMAEQKINHALAAGADYIISTDQSCLMSLDAYIKKNDLTIKTMHLADVLAHGWLEDPEF